MFYIKTPRLSWKYKNFQRQLPIFKELVCYKSRYPVAAVKESRDLPWIQHTEDVFKKEPILHRLIGYFWLRHMMKREGASRLDYKEFASGVRQAVKTIAEIISKHDADEELQHLLGPTLLRQYKIAFEQLKFENKKIELKTESPQRIHISAFRLVFGEVEPGEEFVISLFGQKRIHSKSDLEEHFEETKGSNISKTFKYAKVSSLDAVSNKIRLQIDVKFELLERYSLWEVDDIEFYSQHIVRTPIKMFHRWRFESAIPPPDQEFIFDWNVIDIDDFLKNKALLPEEKDDDPSSLM